MLTCFRPEQLKPRKKQPALTGEMIFSVARWGATYLVQQALRRQRLESLMLELARQRYGVVTVADAVRELKSQWSDCEAVLEKLTRRGCCYRKDQQAFIFEEHLPTLWSCEYCDGVHNQGPACPCCGAPLVERRCQVVAGTGRASKSAPEAKGWPCW